MKVDAALVLSVDHLLPIGKVSMKLVTLES